MQYEGLQSMINENMLMFQQEIIEMFSTLVEEKDVYTAGHSKRVAMYSVKLAEALGLDEEEQTTIYQAGLLHDVGKILTPESILLKPRKFHRHEHEIIKRHSIDGERIVGSISAFEAYAKIIRHHHERYDGEGYPDGLKGEEIPLLSRIMSVADAFDAMTTSRIYKARKNVSQAISEILSQSARQFDPSVVLVVDEVFTKLKDLVHIAQTPESYSVYEERFAYYFKDPLTGVFSADYLNYFLQNNRETKTFQCCYFIQIHRMHSYNESFGWKIGDDTLKEIALRIKALFNAHYIFRVFGDDFIVLNKSHLQIDQNEIVQRLAVGFSPINITVQHFDLNGKEMMKWEQLEDDLVHYDF